MSSRYVRGRLRILLESRQWAALSFFLFSCFLVLTLPLPDDYELSLLSYLTGLLALLAAFRFGGPRTVSGLVITVFVAHCHRLLADEPLRRKNSRHGHERARRSDHYKEPRFAAVIGRAMRAFGELR
jgi:predicted branched-subunit amino acid permease